MLGSWHRVWPHFWRLGSWILLDNLQTHGQDVQDSKGCGRDPGSLAILPAHSRGGRGSVPYFLFPRDGRNQEACNSSWLASQREFHFCKIAIDSLFTDINGDFPVCFLRWPEAKWPSSWSQDEGSSHPGWLRWSQHGGSILIIAGCNPIHIARHPNPVDLGCQLSSLFMLAEISLLHTSTELRWHIW